MSSSSSLLPLYHSYPPSTSAVPPAVTPLSALEKLAGTKGKGKERAIDQVEMTGMEFGVRFTQEEEDLELWVGERETVRDVKRRIYQLRPSLLSIDGNPRTLRFIQLGRLLTDGVALVPYTRQLLKKRERLVKTDLFQVLEEVVNESSTHAEESTVQYDRVWLHCSVGEALETGESEKVQQAQITPLRGFDKLIDAGLSAVEIASMREEFRANAAEPTQEGDEDEHARALEDQWMEGLTNQEAEVRSDTVQGVYVTLFQGVCVGFFVPYLPFFFFRTQIFSKRMQMAIVLGVIVNLLFGLLRFFS